jgi:hypothetical protein
MTIPRCWFIAGSSRSRTPAPVKTCCVKRSCVAAYPRSSTRVATPFVIGRHVAKTVPQAARPAPEPTGIDYLAAVHATHEDDTIGTIHYRHAPPQHGVDPLLSKRSVTLGREVIAKNHRHYFGWGTVEQDCFNLTCRRIDGGRNCLSRANVSRSVRKRVLECERQPTGTNSALDRCGMERTHRNSW